MSYKIIHLITRLDKGGSSENVLLTTTYFAQKGYECSLIYGKTNNPPLELIKKAETAGVKFIPIESLVRSIDPFFDFLTFLRLLRLLCLLRPNVVHTHSSKAGILGRWSAWLSGYWIQDTRYPMVVHTPHGHVFYGYYGRMITAMFTVIEKITAIITDKLIALTEGEKKESLACGVGREEQWKVIHSGVDLSVSPCPTTGRRALVRLSVRSASSTNQLINQLTDKLIVGSVGRLDPVKGYKYFVEAIKIIDARYRMPDTRYLIVGDGEERKSLEFRVESLGIKDKVIFAGWQDDVEEMISLMDIYVQPSVNEGMGKTLIQAQALGKPIVATKVQGIPSVVKDGVTGILVPPQNSVALAEVVIWLIRDKNLREKMGEEGKKWVNETVDGYPRFSTERMLHLIEELYAELLKV